MKEQEPIPWPDEHPTVPIWPTVGHAFNMCRSAAYAAAESGKLPVTVLRCGRSLRASTAELRRVLGLPVSKSNDVA